MAKAEAEAKAKAMPAPPTPPSVPLIPIGSMPALSFEVLSVAEWYATLLDAIIEASEFFLGTYQYDHEGLTDLGVVFADAPRPSASCSWTVRCTA